MSCGLATPSNRFLHPFPEGYRRRLSAVGYRGGQIRPLPVREQRWCGVRFSSRTPPASASVVEVFGSLYELLGIEKSGDCSADEIKRAYKRMALKYHPDVSPPEQAEEYTQRFIEVQEAYETLSDPSRRALYDRDLSRGLHVALSSRRRIDEEHEEITRWRDQWEDQLVELKNRSTNKDSEENLSWGARMRRQRAESPTE